VKAIEFAAAARDELDAAIAYYEEQRPGRGLRLAEAVERLVHEISVLPESGARIPELPDALGLRRRLVPGFPFAVAYRDLTDRIRIDAVAHTHRQPGYWRRRIK